MEENDQNIENNKENKIKKYTLFFLKIILKIICWGLLLILGLINYTDGVSVSIVYILLLFGNLVTMHYTMKQNIKNWEQKINIHNGEAEFFERFLKLYSPSGTEILSYILIFSLINTCSWVPYILINTIPYILDLYYRRYETINIKNDLILSKLNKIGTNTNNYLD